MNFPVATEESVHVRGLVMCTRSVSITEQCYFSYSFSSAANIDWAPRSQKKTHMHLNGRKAACVQCLMLIA